jgi:anti-sigma factor RsiW
MALPDDPRATRVRRAELSRAELSRAELSRAELSRAELSALADGSLPPSRRADLEATISASPDLQVMLAQQVRAVELVRAACEQTYAPSWLRSSFPVARRARRKLRRPRLALAGSLSAAVTAAAFAVVVLSSTSAVSDRSTLAKVTALADRGPTGPPPPSAYRGPVTRLAQSVDDVYFPNWTHSLGWRPVGQRADRVGGRRSVTVYYSWRHARVAYTILSPRALNLGTGHAVRLAGIELRSVRLGERELVTWRRRGDTCVLSGTGVSVSELEQLATWRSTSGV